MILSKVVKAGSQGEGISDWNQELSAWILEFGEESEEFRPFLALGSEPSNHNFKPDHQTDTVLHPSPDSKQWRPIRPLPPSVKQASQFAALPKLAEPQLSADPQLQVDEDIDAEHLEADVESAALATLPEPTYEEGYQAGLEQGLEQAAVQAEKLVQEQLQLLRERVDQVLDDLLAERAALTDQVDEGLARLALHLARQLVRGELRVPGPVISQLVESALIEFPVDGPLTLLLSPADKTSFEQLDLPERDELKLVSDATLSQGSIRLQQGDRRTEDLMEQRLSELAQKLLRNVDPSALAPLQALDTGVGDEAAGDPGSTAEAEDDE